MFKKAKIKKWLPQKMDPDSGIIERAKWSDDFTEPVIFHGFGVNYDEFDSGPGNHTCAIIEYQDGVFDLVAVNKIKLDEPTA